MPSRTPHRNAHRFASSMVVCWVAPVGGLTAVSQRYAAPRLPLNRSAPTSRGQDNTWHRLQTSPGRAPHRRAAHRLATSRIAPHRPLAGITAGERAITASRCIAPRRHASRRSAPIAIYWVTPADGANDATLRNDPRRKVARRTASQSLAPICPCLGDSRQGRHHRSATPRAAHRRCALHSPATRRIVPHRATDRAIPAGGTTNAPLRNAAPPTASLRSAWRSIAPFSPWPGDTGQGRLHRTAQRGFVERGTVTQYTAPISYSWPRCL